MNIRTVFRGAAVHGDLEGRQAIEEGGSATRIRRLMILERSSGASPVLDVSQDIRPLDGQVAADQ
jgi:hypothetical protein